MDDNDNSARMTIEVDIFDNQHVGIWNIHIYLHPSYTQSELPTPGAAADQHQLNTVIKKPHEL